MIKIGVIGVNQLGEAHIKTLRKLEGIKLIGVFDSNQPKLEEISKKYKIKPFTDVNDLLHLVDAVDIVKSTEQHFCYASKAIKLSKHVFIEKPVTKTVEEAKKLSELSKEAGVIVQVGHIERFNPAFKSAQAYISNPMFIETHRMIEFNTSRANIPVVLDLMSHDLDIVLSLVNANIKRINATGVEVIGSSPDIVNAVLEFDNGCVANLTASRISLKNERITKIYQKDAHIKVDYLRKKTELFALKTNGERKIGSKKIKIIEEKPLKEEFIAFINCINNKTMPQVGIHDGSRMLAVACQIAEKLKVTASLIED